MKKYNPKIISGGQTGADLAGLWAALLWEIPTGGMAPKGWKTIDGSMPQLESLFGLTESESGYHGRTLQNCENSDLTLIFASNIKSPGTRLTIHHCITNKIPYKIYAFGDDIKMSINGNLPRIILEVRNNLILNPDAVINIAGNSTSTSQKTFTYTFHLLCHLFYDLFEYTPKIIQDNGIEKVEMLLRDCYDQETYDKLIK